MLRKLYDLQFVQAVPARLAQPYSRACIPQVPPMGGTPWNPYHPVGVQQQMLVAHPITSAGTPMFLVEQPATLHGQSFGWGAQPIPDAVCGAPPQSYGSTLSPDRPFWPVINAGTHQYDIDQQANDWGLNASDVSAIGTDSVVGADVALGHASYPFYQATYDVGINGVSHMVRGARHVGLPTGLMPWLYHGAPLWSSNYTGITYENDTCGNAVYGGTDRNGAAIYCWSKTANYAPNLSFMAFQDFKGRLFVASVIGTNDLDGTDPLKSSPSSGGTDANGGFATDRIFAVFPASVETWLAMTPHDVGAKLFHDGDVMAFQLDAQIYP